MTGGANVDPLLEAFFRADDTGAARELQVLLEDVAGPVIAQVLRRRGAVETGDLESIAREELITRLLAWRSGDDPSAIANFRAYAAVIAYHVWAQHLRDARPGRSMLLNRLRYLVENRTNKQLFATWQNAQGQTLCALATRSHSAYNATPRLQWLLADPDAAARDVFGRGDYVALPFAQVVLRFLRWLDAPIELREFTEALSELLQYDRAAPESPQLELLDPAPSAVDAAKWQEYLAWLWLELRRLPLRQRTAFLLHADVTRELDEFRIASAAEIAAALDISADEFNSMWKTLPQEDNAIASRLGLQRQQVINLRRVARDQLGAAWREWIK